MLLMVEQMLLMMTQKLLIMEQMLLMVEQMLLTMEQILQMMEQMLLIWRWHCRLCAPPNPILLKKAHLNQVLLMMEVKDMCQLGWQ